jgi:3-oxoacyl-[acyl-carrier-protein] synthase-3
MSRAAVVAGLGVWTPARVVTNAELASYLDTSDEWIRTRTGIRQRFLVGPGEATSDLAVEAGRRALDSARTSTADALVVATTTADRPCPAVAPEVASRLGLGTIAALDVGAVCSGFVYALATAAGFIAAKVADSVLVIGSDAFSTLVDPADRASRVLFGDGAGAVLLRAGSADEQGALLNFELGSDGERSDLLQVPGGGSRQRSTGLPIKEEDSYFQMAGGTVFAQAVQRMSATVGNSVDRTGWSIGDVDRFVLHQANARILTAVAQRLDVPAEKFLSNIDRVGNTAAASIALALADGVSSGQLRPGQRTVLAAFGGGLTWGSVTLVWPELRLE